MFSKTNVKGTFYKSSRMENTEKVAYGRFSEGINTGKKNEQGKDVFEYESWDVRFVGNAREKAAALEDKTPITLNVWAARNPYNKEKKRSYPYLLVTDFEVREKSGEAGDEAPAEGEEQGLPI